MIHCIRYPDSKITREEFIVFETQIQFFFLAIVAKMVAIDLNFCSLHFEQSYNIFEALDYDKTSAKKIQMFDLLFSSLKSEFDIQFG